MIKDSVVNSSFHNYDWEIKNTKNWQPGLRRFWVCWNKNVDEKQLFNDDVLVNQAWTGLMLKRQQQQREENVKSVVLDLLLELREAKADAASTRAKLQELQNVLCQ
jgi:hypothetical protein